jgi:hypothetical protein
MDRDGKGFVKVLVRPPLDIEDSRIVDLTEIQRARIVTEWKDKGVHAFWSTTPTREYLEQELSRHPEWVIRQQYLCEFQEVQDQALSPEMVEQAFQDGGGRKIGGESFLSDGEGRRVG